MSDANFREEWIVECSTGVDHFAPQRWRSPEAAADWLILADMGSCKWHRVVPLSPPVGPVEGQDDADGMAVCPGCDRLQRTLPVDSGTLLKRVSLLIDDKQHPGWPIESMAAAAISVCEKHWRNTIADEIRAHAESKFRDEQLELCAAPIRVACIYAVKGAANEIADLVARGTK